MIERVKNEDVFKKALRDIFLKIDNNNLFLNETLDISYSEDCLIDNAPNYLMLIWDDFIWVNKNEEGTYDAMIWFRRNRDCRSKEEFFDEHLWLSHSTEEVNLELLKLAIDFARTTSIKYISSNIFENENRKESLKNLYKKLGYKKQQSYYIAKL